MPEKKNKKTPLFITRAVAICVLVMVLVVPVMFFDKILLGVLHVVYGHNVSAVDTRYQIPSTVIMEGVEVIPGDESFLLSAEKAAFFVDVRASREQRALVLRCDIKRLKVLPYKKGEEKALAGQGLTELLIFPEDSLYDVTFLLTAGGGNLSITALEILSPEIKVSGSYFRKDDLTTVEIELNISVSKPFYESLPSDLRSAGFSEDEDGRYSMVITYRGNPVFLKALYAVTL